MARVEALARWDRKPLTFEVEALLGGVDAPKITISEALEDFFVLARDRVLNKSPEQVRRFETSRRL